MRFNDASFLETNMKYVKCNVKLLNELSLLTTALFSAVHRANRLPEANSKWVSFIDTYIQQTKEAVDLNKEGLLQEDIFLEEKALIEKSINTINTKKEEFLSSEIDYLNETFKYFTSCPVTYLDQEG